MKKSIIISALLFVLLFSACDSMQEAASADREQEVPSQSQQTASKAITAEDLFLKNYIELYERYCAGHNFTNADEESGGQLLDFAAGYLAESGLINRYAVYDDSEIQYYTIPLEDLSAVCRLFFGESDGLTEEQVSELYYSPDFFKTLSGKFALAVEVESTERLENGHYRVRVRRYIDKREIYPAVYEFAPALMEDSPSHVMEGLFSRGDAVFQIISVQDQPMPEQPEGEIIIINTPQDLVELADLVNSGDWVYQNNIYELKSDLDMTGVEMSPIGSYVRLDRRDPAPTGFCGTFNGQGRTISNLTIESGGPAGLFAVIGRGGMVSNLSLENCSVTAVTDNYPEQSHSAGGIAGVVGGTLFKSSFSGTVSGAGSVGGLAGTLESGQINSCRADVVVTGNNAVGGLIGTTSLSKLYDCTAVGTVNAAVVGGQIPREIGGYIGSNNDTTIDHGIVSTEVKTFTNAQWVGSVMGYNYGSLKGCFYNKDVSSNWKTIAAPYNGAEYTVDLTGLTQDQMIEMGVLDG